ncbi:hypothetical protein AJ78_02420 [Emergomyces pasteurianus Ep9510]|uniref:Uncharacterized protein n=1 Tax=Emergomyces pasteurianus Ep9510 TaxID=1447872 RepID=A0A1J9QB75_9EURO|nr:hypothetical protein AJ78_02420 [Emergomyces pasteurianus Ep9510]
MQKPKLAQTPEMRPDSSQSRKLLQQANERRDRIIAVSSKVYGLAKFVLIILIAYGVELDNTPSGIKFHIERVEDQMIQDYTSQLLQTIEDLFYALYARLNIEISTAQLSESFQLDVHGKTALTRQSSYLAASAAVQYLPVPDHINTIFQACKRLLASEDICGILDQEIICMHQATYVYVANNKNRGHCHPDDVLRYRRHVEMVVLDSNSPFAMQWVGLNPIYKHAPGLVLAMLSEKYLGFQHPVDRNKDGNSSNNKNSYEYAAAEVKTPLAASAPFPTTITTAMAIMRRKNSVTSSGTTSSSSSSSSATLSTHRLLPERRRTEANREAAYAMLNSISVGEHRRIEGKRALRQYVRDQLCICFGYCSCARKCTLKSARACPCSARMSIICDVDIGQYGDQQWLAEEGQEQQPVLDARENFSNRSAQLGCALFAGLCSVKKGTVMSFFEVYMEVKAGSEVFHQEVLAYRESMGKM